MYHDPILQGIQQPLIFIDIPTFKEAPYILRSIETSKINNIKIIVADGGSTDETRDKLGYFKTLLINQVMIIGYHAGIAIDKLESFYLRNKGEKRKIEI